MTGIDQALGEFIDAWNAGERPDVDACLARVPDGPEREELSGALLAWLEVAPAPDYTEAQLTEIRADPILQAALAAGREAGQPWSVRLPAFRARAGLALSDLAERLTAGFGLAGQEARTVAYLERMEQDALDERRVSRRLLDGLAAALGVDPDQVAPTFRAALPAMPPPAAAAGGTLFRAAETPDGNVDIDLLARAAMSPAPAKLDELDRLFLGGPDA